MIKLSEHILKLRKIPQLEVKFPSNSDTKRFYLVLQDSVYRPIAFCSKRLLPHQLHWAPAQLEAYAVYYSVCEKWRYYLTLNKTIVHTDHRNLSWLFKQSQKGMIGRWFAHLCAYDLDIIYVQGKTQVTADPLSRLLRQASLPPEWIPSPTTETPPVAALLSTITNGIIKERASHPPLLTTLTSTITAVDFDFITSFMHPNDSACNLPRAKWAHEQRNDPRLGHIYRFLTRTTTKTNTPVPKWVRTAAQSYRLDQGILQYRSLRKVGDPADHTAWVIAVPHSLRNAVIQECHDNRAAGHRGMVKTTMLLRQRYHFLGLRKAVRKYISQCAKCTQAKSARSSRSLPLTPMFSPAPFLAIAIDIYKPGTTLLNGYKYILTVVDMCTRWVHFIPLKSKYSVEVLLALCHKWFAFHGIPEFILSDRGKEFMGVVSTICQATGIKQIRTTPWHPQSNGLCEVQHATLTRELRIRAQGREVDWDALLPEIQFAFNVTPDDITPGLSPFQLVYGRKPRMSPRDVAFPARIVPPPMPPQHTKYVNTIVKKLQSLHLSALDKQIQRKEDLRRKHDNTRAPLADTLPKRGDVVFVHKPTTTTQKLLMQWSPPCHLVLQAHQNTCLVRPLTSPAGRGGKFPQDVTRNMSSVKVVTLRPADFWIGARVLRKHKQVWFLVTVIDVQEDEGKTLYQVDYDDCGKEDIDAGVLYDSIVYHPRLEQNLFEDTQLPSVGQAMHYVRSSATATIRSNRRDQPRNAETSSSSTVEAELQDKIHSHCPLQIH